MFTGNLIGACSGVVWSTNLAFIGQYCVRPEYEGKGIGSELWAKVMQHIGKDNNVSLFAATNMFEKYRVRSGFSIVPEKRLHYYEGNLNCDQLLKTIAGISLAPISEDNIAKVTQYDKQVTGLDRKVVIEGLAKTNGNVSAVALNQDQQVLGFCVLSVANIGVLMIEPLYADDLSIAEVLINKCSESLSTNQTNRVIYHFWDSHPTSKAIAEKLGLNYMNIKEPVLFTKEAVEGDKNKIFSPTNSSFFPF